MKQTVNTVTTDKQRYQSPALQVIGLAAVPLLNNVSATGAYNGISYGGNGDGEEGD